MKRFIGIFLLLASFTIALRALHSADSSAPTVDRVGFPHGYLSFQVLRSVVKPEKAQRVTVYGNQLAASVAQISKLPYPYGSVLVMETASLVKDSNGKVVLDEKANPRQGTVQGLHVMRKQPGFGEAYGKNRTGEWEYVEYRADGSFITPPQKSFACAECHLKAAETRDFVYRGRFEEIHAK